ncbi:helix-turn-helix domain-containing protein, partial [Candidatus Woesearchaeota archaeon]|nr:helix-turn-helix domain-containing protein [Candidatus Woesearchaeota archaeon]
MWVGKFRIWHECFILSNMEKRDIKVLAYVLGVHEEHDSLYYTTLLIPVGKTEDVSGFISDLRNDPQVIKVEEESGQLITLTKAAKDRKHVSSYFSHDMFLVEPIIHEAGFEYWHLASWDREKLASFYSNVRQIGNIELMKLQEEKLRDVFYPRIMPQLSPQQKKAFDLALEYGYFSYPQKIHLEELAK